MRAKLRQTKKWLKENRTESAEFIMDRIRRSLIGYYNYYCITDNSPTVDLFRDNIRTLLFKWLNRRSQKKSFTWEKFVLFLKKFPLPRPTVKVNIYQLRDHISYIL
ncbi:group II intron maturase-specific domain-containing protein [Lentibacillus halophilus]|uniref:group II intron maturase-specific domain-containing protein n=1 Tax=Lentibacillus halophilus TaxID=295065 RepID=UPI0031D6AD1A